PRTFAAAPPVQAAAQAPAKASAKSPPPAGSPAPAAAELPPEAKRAIELAQTGELPAAIALLEPLARKPGAHPFLPNLLGSLHLQSQRPAEALAILSPLAEG